MKQIKLLLILILLFTIPAASIVSGQQTAPTPRQVFKVEKPEQIFSVLEGKWDWEYLEKSCQDNPFMISFSENHKELYLTYENSKNAEGKTEKKTYTYNLLAISLFGVRGQMQDEKRLTDNKQPIIWQFILLSKDEFCWHRTDWAQGTCTKKIVRCK